MVNEELKLSMTQWRHHLHANPELGFNEHKTASFIEDLLTQWNIEHYTGVGGTGVVARLTKGNSDKSIALRADIDALPIQEINDFDYRSTQLGVMHACGHDGHTSMLLGAAKYLADHGEFNGSVVFIFQPNEEHGEGALAMIDDGLFDRFRVDEIYGMHNIPGMEINTFASRPGIMCASESLFEINIQAQGGHAAAPHMGVDAIIVGAEVVNALQTVIARKIDPAESGVVSVTEFITDGCRNVLPGNAILKGDVRALNPQTRNLIEQKMRQIIEGIAISHGVTIDFSFESVFIEVINDNQITNYAVNAAQSISPNVQNNINPITFSEDFAHFAAQRPGCFMLMGNGTDGSHGQPLHSPDYNFNDNALIPGVNYWVSLVEQRLNT